MKISGEYMILDVPEEFDDSLYSLEKIHDDYVSVKKIPQFDGISLMDIDYFDKEEFKSIKNYKYKGLSPLVAVDYMGNLQILINGTRYEYNPPTSIRNVVTLKGVVGDYETNILGYLVILTDINFFAVDINGNLWLFIYHDNKKLDYYQIPNLSNIKTIKHGYKNYIYFISYGIYYEYLWTNNKLEKISNLDIYIEDVTNNFTSGEILLDSEKTIYYKSSDYSKGENNVDAITPISSGGASYMIRKGIAYEFYHEMEPVEIPGQKITQMYPIKNKAFGAITENGYVYYVYDYEFSKIPKFKPIKYKNKMVKLFI